MSTVTSHSDTSARGGSAAVGYGGIVIRGRERLGHFGTRVLVICKLRSLPVLWGAL